MEDVLGDILSTVNFKSVVYFKHGFCSPWGMEVSKGTYSQFHLLTHGNCVVKIAGEFIPLEKGDLVIFPHGDPHQIKDNAQSVCKPGQEVVQAIMAGAEPFGDSVPNAHLICGHYEMDRELSHTIFSTLPSFILIKSNEYGRFGLLCSSLELIMEEMTLRKAGYETVSFRMAEVLFISIIRHYYIHQSKEKLNLFKDELIYQALDLVHRKLAEHWSIERLARAAGISRTLFIERFKQSVGMPPMTYVTNWRLTKAKYLLKHTDLPLTQIGEKIGYPSDSSFNRAFKQRFEISPGKWRSRG